MVDEMDRRVAHMLFLHGRQARAVAEFAADAAMHLNIGEPLWREERRAFHAATSAACLIEDLARRVVRKGLPLRERRLLEKFMQIDERSEAARPAKKARNR